MTTTDEHTRGWALAPARLPREDVRSLRRLYTTVRGILPLDQQREALAVLHVDREDTRKLALAKLGARAPGVLVRAVAVSENTIDVTVYASVTGDVDGTQVAHHKFRRTTPMNEWTRILGRHCRHALGVLAHLRIRTLAEIFSEAVRRK